MELIRNRVSVIIPVYNAENFLRGTLDDLRNQSYQDIEIILIDDGSEDGSAKIIQEYALRDERVRFIKVENGGPSKARNLGLSIAKGEYIRFIDADDRIPNDSINNMVQGLAMQQDIDLVIGNYAIDVSAGYFTGLELHEGMVTAKEFAEIFIDYMKTFYFGVPWNKLYKREIIEKYHIRFNENIDWCEDFLFNVEYFSKCNKMFILKVPQGVYKYCTRETGITSSVSHRDIEEIDKIEELRYQKMKQYCKDIGLLERFELEWKYAGLYERLSIMTKYFRNESVKEKFKKFKQYLSKEDAYQYICYKWNKTNYKSWRLLKEAIEKKKYLKVFLFFIKKGIHSKHKGSFLRQSEIDMQENEIKK